MHHVSSAHNIQYACKILWTVYNHSVQTDTNYFFPDNVNHVRYIQDQLTGIKNVAPWSVTIDKSLTTLAFVSLVPLTPGHSLKEPNAVLINVDMTKSSTIKDNVRTFESI